MFIHFALRYYLSNTALTLHHWVILLGCVVWGLYCLTSAFLASYFTFRTKHTLRNVQDSCLLFAIRYSISERTRLLPIGYMTLIIYSVYNFHCLNLISNLTPDLELCLKSLLTSYRILSALSRMVKTDQSLKLVGPLFLIALTSFSNIIRFVIFSRTLRI